MNIYKILKKNGKKILKTKISGKSLLSISQLNKGTAFSKKEREIFNLEGKLPQHIETIDDQVARVYKQVNNYSDPFRKNIYLNTLLNNNQTLFYALIIRYLEELLPFIYTPVVGAAVKLFSHEFRSPRGLFISYHDKDNIAQILKNRTNREIEIIVVTDGEGVLGIGDQGLGGADIPIAKLMVYTVCGGIDPNKTLPIFLDVGTNNEDLLNDPLYVGLKQKRISDKDYYEFIDQFIIAIKSEFPNALLHWEDFSRQKAINNLNNYRDIILSFNDDIQGTGVITSAAILTIARINKISLDKQRIVIFGAGAAGIGITEHIITTMMQSGISLEDAKKCFWLIDKYGLLTDQSIYITDSQQKFIRSSSEIKEWDIETNKNIELLEVISNVKPTILIGCSGVHGAFSNKVVEEMKKNVKLPAILPLSNPTYCAEVIPQDLIQWTDANILLATGSPFKDVIYKGKTYNISQCNNAIAYPGISLGALAVSATKITDDMLYAATEAISNYTYNNYGDNKLLPEINDCNDVAKDVALNVAKKAVEQSLTPYKNISEDKIKELIESKIWVAEYIDYEVDD